LFLVREDRNELTSGLGAVPPGASPVAMSGTDNAEASKREANSKIRNRYRVVGDDHVDSIRWKPSNGLSRMLLIPDRTLERNCGSRVLRCAVSSVYRGTKATRMFSVLFCLSAVVLC